MKYLNLIMQSYPSKGEKLNEHMFCLEQNLNNSNIKKIYNFKEEYFEYPDYIIQNKNFHKVCNVVVDKTKTKQKSERIIRQSCYQYSPDFEENKNDLSKRITYKYIVDYVRENLPEDELILIINCDIFIDYNWEYNKLLDFMSDEKLFMIFSRHEYDKDDKKWMDFNAMHAWSNDAWLFSNTSNLNNLQNINFTIGGCPSCDNAITDRFYKAGFKVINGGFYFPIYHFDRITKSEPNKLYITNYTDLSLPSNDGQLFICPFLPIELCKLSNYYELIPKIHNYAGSNCIKFYDKHHNHNVTIFNKNKNIFNESILASMFN